METLIQQTVNQAHNGYLEVYLNLGWVGVVLLSIILISGYRRITAAVRSGAPVASLRLAYFIVAVTYNFTEASFKMMSPVWMAFLIATMILPETPVQEDFSSFGKDRAGSLGETKPEPAGSVVHARHPVRV
jgi:O-antigen ligase